MKYQSKNMSKHNAILNVLSVNERKQWERSIQSYTAKHNKSQSINDKMSG